MLGPRDLPLLPVFVAVAGCGSFTQAARNLRLAKSVVSQHVRTLEERCGVRLIERTTRTLRLTQVGERVLMAARAVTESVRDLERVVEGERADPAGVLRVTAPHDSGIEAALAPVCAALLRRHPALRVELIFDDGVRDLVREGLDVALRLGPLASSSYIVRRLAKEHEIVVASPSVDDAAGDTSEPRDLAGAPWVVHGGLVARGMWTFRSERAAQQIAVTPRATANSTGALRSLVLEGAGFGVLPRHVVLEDLEAGRLRHVCPAWYRRKLSLHALLPARAVPPRVRLFLEGVSEAFRRRGLARG